MNDFTYIYISFWLTRCKMVSVGRRNELVTRGQLSKVDTTILLIGQPHLSTGVPRSQENAHPPRTPLGP